MTIASHELLPHISVDGCRLPHTSGRWPEEKMLQKLSSVSWMQRIPAGFPPGMPGIDDEMDGAMQQAAHPDRHSMSISHDSAAGVKPLAGNGGLAESTSGLGYAV